MKNKIKELLDELDALTDDPRIAELKQEIRKLEEQEGSLLEKAKILKAALQNKEIRKQIQKTTNDIQKLMEGGLVRHPVKDKIRGKVNNLKMLVEEIEEVDE